MYRILSVSKNQDGTMIENNILVFQRILDFIIGLDVYPALLFKIKNQGSLVVILLFPQIGPEGRDRKPVHAKQISLHPVSEIIPGSNRFLYPGSR
jgi:hypothetical protein